MKLSRDLVVFDLETTGAWIEKDRIIEIALIKRCVDGGEEIYHKRVNPEMKIPPVITKLTGISDTDVQEAPRFKDIAAEVKEFIGECDFGGFNVERFDLPLLEREMREAGIDFPWRERTVYDAQKVYHLNEKRDLTAAYRYYCQKELDGAHSALVDTQATLEILQSQITQYGAGNDSIGILSKFEYKKLGDFYDEDRKFRWWDGKLYMMFGKYARKYTLQEVVQRDRAYLEWILSANFSEEVKELVQNALNGQFPAQETQEPDGRADDEDSSETEEEQLDLF